MAVLGFLTKLKSGLGLAIGAHISLLDTQSTDKVSISYPFSFSRYQTKCVIKFLLRQLNMSSKAMADREKRGEDENIKI